MEKSLLIRKYHDHICRDSVILIKRNNIAVYENYISEESTEVIHMITKSLIELIFSAASIERWNDHPRPIHFSEMAKQAHKFIIAYVIAKREEERGTEIDWIKLIEGGISEFLHRVVVTDIKPPVFHKLMEQKEQRDKLNEWVIQKHLKRDLSLLSEDLYSRFYEYLISDEPQIEKKILSAAHYLATKLEFDLIYDWSKRLYGIEKTKTEINSQIGEHRDLKSVEEMLASRELPDRQKGLYGFVAMVGQLRFQKRWAQTPRIPQTSVLGHLLFVAVMSYFISIEIGACEKRRYNDFYGGLFHDLPEVLTRDIISPVKKSVEGLDEMIKLYEKESMEKQIFPLLPISWHKELRYFTEDEFANKIRTGEEEIKLMIDNSEMNGKYNEDKWDPIDGELIEACDKLAAFIEASTSINIGIRSPALEEGKRSLYERFENSEICGFSVGQLFDLFK